MTKYVFLVAAVGASGGCLADVKGTKDPDSPLTQRVDGKDMQVVPVDREIIATYAPNLLIDLRDPTTVYLIDGTAPESSLIATRLVCPNGMQTNVADFLLGQGVAWGPRGSLVALSSASVEATQAVVDKLEVCEMECYTCPDGATFCIEMGDCTDSPEVMADLTNHYYDDSGSTREDQNIDPPAWAGPPPEGDPDPYTGNGWEGGSGTDPRADYGGYDDSGYGSGGGNSSSGGSGGGGGGGDGGGSSGGGGPDYY